MLANRVTAETWHFVLQHSVVGTVSVGEMQGIAELTNVTAKAYKS